MPDSLSSAAISFEERLVGELDRLERFTEARFPGVGKDVAQEALLRAWRGRSGFDATRDLWPWLRTVAENAAARRLEIEARDRVASVDASEVHERQAEVDLHPDEALDVEPFLQRLGAADREIVERFYFGGASIAEIAAERGCPEGTVKSQLSRARKRLAAILSCAVLMALVLLAARSQRSTADPEPSGSTRLRLGSYKIRVEVSREVPPASTVRDLSAPTTPVQERAWQVTGGIVASPLHPSSGPNSSAVD